MHNLEATRRFYEEGRRAAKAGKSALDVVGATGTLSNWQPCGQYGGQALSWEQATRLCGWLDRVHSIARSQQLENAEAAEREQSLNKVGKVAPIGIWNETQRHIYYADDVSNEEREAWNDYAQAEADTLNNSDTLDSYDSTNTITGYDPDTGRVTSWAPPARFVDWLTEHRRQQNILKQGSVLDRKPSLLDRLFNRVNGPS